MASFSNAPTKPKPRPKGALKTKKSGALTRSGNGAVAYVEGDKTALFTLAVTNMVGETTFYESAGTRDNRFVQLIHTVAVADPEWIAGFVPYLRNVANMRTASIVVAAEAAKALLDARPKGVQVTPISVPALIDSAMARADEPAEMLAYWLSVHGRPIPTGVKRGINRGINRLYKERSLIKYDGQSRDMRFSDVIEMTHPKPNDERQALLFRHAIERRHGNLVLNDEPGNAYPGLPILSAAAHLDSIPEGDRRAALETYGSDVLNDAGFTWERLSGWIPGGMDAAAWEAIIPSMGYMALLRNLRNFEQAKVSKAVLKSVRDKLEDPEEVAKSRQFPFRFYSAWANSGSTFFASALEVALELSVQNIPKFKGRTLVAIDTSGSMDAPISDRSTIMRWAVGALFAAAVNAQNDCTLIAYGDNWETVKIHPSVLRTVDEVNSRLGMVGHGTETWPSVLAATKEHGPFDRVIVFTDMQDNPPTGSYRSYRHSYGYGRNHGGKPGLEGILPTDLPVYVWDLAGYGRSNIDTNTPGRYLMGGFSDSAFRLIEQLEAGANADWPWLD